MQSSFGGQRQRYSVLHNLDTVRSLSKLCPRIQHIQHQDRYSDPAPQHTNHIRYVLPGSNHPSTLPLHSATHTQCILLRTPNTLRPHSPHTLCVPRSAQSQQDMQSSFGGQRQRYLVLHNLDTVRSLSKLCPRTQHRKHHRHSDPAPLHMRRRQCGTLQSL